MSLNLKRYRQISLFESFSSAKRLKINSVTMNESANKEEPSDDPEEKKTLSITQSASNESQNVCQVVEDSIKIMCESSEAKTERNDQDLFNDSGNKYSDDLFPSDPSVEDYSFPGTSNSEELFPDSSKDDSPESESTSDSDEVDQMSILNKMPDCSLSLPKLEPLENHSIMFSPHIRPGDAPRPYPREYRDRWDSDYVHMPCSPLNRCAVQTLFGEKKIESRWDIICQSLRSDIESSKELEDAIMKYNSQYIGKWNFRGLHKFINQYLIDVERDHFFETLLPAMVDMALNLPNICTKPVPLLKTGKDHYITISQKQIGCLLLNAFFCTFPRRNAPSRREKYKWNSNYASYPDINFNRLFAGPYDRSDKVRPSNMEKLKCILNYFKRIITDEPTGTMTFHRQVIHERDLPKWHASTRGIRSTVIRASGLIETDGQGMLQVDFANRYIGGGILGQGCVQEEIRFAICPELIVACLFVERLASHEVLIITGVEQYSKYSGYAETFKWEGDFKDETPRDSWGRRFTQLVAMDATKFKNSAAQFEFSFMRRELNKAYCGFYQDGHPTNLPTIATGNWGCGAFRGNPKLKFLLQLMAASQSGRSLLYFTFGNKKLKTELQKMSEFLSDTNLAVSDVWRLLLRYIDSLRGVEAKDYPDLFDFIYSQFKITKDSSNQKTDKGNEDQLFDDSDKRAMSKMFEDITFDGSTDIEDNT